MATHFMKVGDRYPVLAATLTKPDGTAQDLTGYTVKLLMRLRDSATLKVNAAASIVTPAAGTVSYAWGATDTDTAGAYVAEFEITETSTTKKQTFPNTGYFEVYITPDLG